MSSTWTRGTARSELLSGIWWAGSGEGVRGKTRRGEKRSIFISLSLSLSLRISVSELLCDDYYCYYYYTQRQTDRGRGGEQRIWRERRASIFTYIHTYYVRIRIYGYTYVRIRTYVCMYNIIYVYVHMYVYMYFNESKAQNKP